MQDLRLVSVSEDGTHLLLATGDGEEFRLPIDAPLNAAIRGDRTRLGQLQIELESQLRPAEIQPRIRAGATAEEVAQAAGVPVERVRRYEGPVVAERQHTARIALATAGRREPDGTPAPHLGDVVAETLEARGVHRDALEWDAWRRDDGRWTVRLEYPVPGRDGAESATWIFDPTRRLVPADGDEARRLVDPQPESPAPASGRRLTSVRSLHDPDQVFDQQAETRVDPQPQPHLEPEPDLEPEPEQPAAATPLHEPEPPRSEPDAEPRPQTPPEPAAAEAGPPARSGKARGKRPAVPSWDDIVFGARKRD
jgi:hypothetical protein